MSEHDASLRLVPSGLASEGPPAAPQATLGLTVGSCKVGLTNIDAAWVLADVTWFQDEQTLFVFYHVDAQ